MEYNIDMTRGDTLSFGMEFTDLDQDLDTAFFSVKQNIEDDEYLFQKSIGDGITKISTGKYAVRVAPGDTYNLPLGQYYYDLEISVNDDVLTIIKGILDLGFDVTREG